MSESLLCPWCKKTIYLDRRSPLKLVRQCGGCRQTIVLKDGRYVRKFSEETVREILTGRQLRPAR